jgi:hypothetical protein
VLETNLLNKVLYLKTKSAHGSFIKNGDAPHTHNKAHCYGLHSSPDIANKPKDKAIFVQPQCCYSIKRKKRIVQPTTSHEGTKGDRGTALR